MAMQVAVIHLIPAVRGPDRDNRGSLQLRLDNPRYVDLPDFLKTGVLEQRMIFYSYVSKRVMQIQSMGTGGPGFRKQTFST
jgi:hypothetical protein